MILIKILTGDAVIWNTKIMKNRLSPVKDDGVKGILILK